MRGSLLTRGPLLRGCSAQDLAELLLHAQCYVVAVDSLEIRDVDKQLKART